MSQAARLGWLFHLLADRGWERDHALSLPAPVPMTRAFYLPVQTVFRRDIMTLRSPHIIYSLVLVCLLVSAGCSSPTPTVTEQINAAPAEPSAISLPTPTTAPAPESIGLIDGLGRTVALPAPARHIVSLAPSNTESLFAIGAGDQVVGRDEFSNYPAQVSQLPSIGGGFGDYNYEAIVALQPDLVLAAEINTPEQVQALEKLGLVIFFLPNPTSLDEMYANLITLAHLTGREAEAAILVENLQSRAVAVVKKLSAATDRPTIFYELDSTDPNAPWTAGPGTFIDTLITLAGGENIAAHLEDQYPQISLEELLVKNPEIILLGDAAYGVTPESVLTRPGWASLDAVQNQHVYPFDDDLVIRPGPRLVDGLEALARLFHPDL